MFTWFGPLQKCSKLDRALLNQAWCTHFNGSLKELGRKHSYHIRLLLYSSKLKDWGPKPCKPFNIWLENKELQELIRTSLKDSPLPPGKNSGQTKEHQEANPNPEYKHQW